MPLTEARTKSGKEVHILSLLPKPCLDLAQAHFFFLANASHSCPPVFSSLTTHNYDTAIGRSSLLLKIT